MRDPKRIDEIINKIKDIWNKYPDLRLGQLILCNVREEDLFYIDDNELLRRLDDFESNHTV